MTVELTRSGDCALLTLNRPDALNALSFDILRDIGRALDEVAAMKDARALLVTGAETPADEVRGVLQAVFEQADLVAAGSPAGGQITRATAPEGVTIPMHEAADRYFKTDPTPR